LYAEGLIVANVKDLPILRDDDEEERGNNSKESPRTTIASIKKEMQKPRLTESVRNDWRYQAMLTAEGPAHSG
jgi:hypothetical protein